MIVDAHIYYWHPEGMREHAGMSQNQYVLKEDAERLLEEAYERGKQSVLQK